MASKSMNISEGKLLPQIIKFTIPLILTNIFQQLYNIIDQMIAGKFAGEGVLAAIGATGHLTSLFINLVIGISVGVSAVVAQTIGSGDDEVIHKSIHTSMATSVWCGLIVGVLGIFLAKPMLLLLNTPDSIINQSTLYLAIILGGFITSSIYNFGAAILRATGDTKRPLLFLSISGAIKVISTFVFVVIFRWGVVAIACATIISQLISAVLVVNALLKQPERYRLCVKNIKIYKAELIRILKMGVPIGLQTSMVAISNVIIQASINSFGDSAIAGAAATNNINSILYSILTSMSHTSTIFCSQSFGANKPKRLLSSLYISLVLCVIVGLFSGTIFQLLSLPIIKLFVQSKEAISFALEYASVICLTYSLSGIMETLSGGLRAINKSTLAMVSSALGLCSTRIIWVFTYFASHRSMTVLYYSYPLSWVVTSIINLVLFIIFFRRTIKVKKEQQ